MPRPRILLTQAIHPEAQAALAALGEVIVAPDTRPDTLRAQAAGCAVIVVRAALPDDIFSANAALIGAVRHGAGLDMIPIAAATAAGVLVGNVPGVNARSVAEHVIRSLLALARRSGPMAATLQAGGSAAWGRARAWADAGGEISGRTLGLVGYGNVGQAVAAIATGGFGMRVLVQVRSELPAGAPARRSASLDELLASCDALVLACPLTAQTRGLIGAAQLARMQPGALLVNVARGPVLVTEALVAALQSGRLGGAALDVFDSVPLPPADPLWSLAEGGANLLLTPHVAGISEDSMRAMGQGVVAAVAAILAGGPPARCVNPQALPAFLARRVG